MNSDEIKSLVVKVLILVLTSLATALHLDPTATSIFPALATDLADAGVLLYGVYAHWNMKKVPETAVVVAK